MIRREEPSGSDERRPERVSSGNPYGSTVARDGARDGRFGVRSCCFRTVVWPRAAPGPGECTCRKPFSRLIWVVGSPSEGPSSWSVFRQRAAWWPSRRTAELSSRSTASAPSRALAHLTSIAYLSSLGSRPIVLPTLAVRSAQPRAGRSRDCWSAAFGYSGTIGRRGCAGGRRALGIGRERHRTGRSCFH